MRTTLDHLHLHLHLHWPHHTSTWWLAHTALAVLGALVLLYAAGVLLAGALAVLL